MNSTQIHSGLLLIGLLVIVSILWAMRLSASPMKASKSTLQYRNQCSNSCCFPMEALK